MRQPAAPPRRELLQRSGVLAVVVPRRDAKPEAAQEAVVQMLAIGARKRSGA